MKCTRCEKEMEGNPAVYSVHGLFGWYCYSCAKILGNVLGLKIIRVINLPYYINQEVSNEEGKKETAKAT